MDLIAFGVAFVAVAGLLWLDPPIPARVRPSWVVSAIAGIGAGAAVLADTAPTGWEPLDTVARAVFVGACTLAGSVVPPRLTLLSATIATVVGVATGSSAAWMAAAALGATVALEFSSLRAPVVTALAGGLAAQSLLRIEWPETTGASLVAGAVASAPLLVAWFGHLHHDVRRRIVLAAFGLASFAAVGAGVGLLAATQARDDVDVGIAETRAGLETLGDDPETARGHFAEATEAFDRAGDRLGAWWARPAYATPIVAQHARAARTLSSAGEDLASLITASEALTDRDLTGGGGASIDLEVMAEIGVELADAAAALAAASAQLDDTSTPWLTGEVQRWHDSVERRLDDAREGLDVAAEAVALVPDLLGGDEPRRYFLAIQNPAEARGSGGFMGNWGILTAEDGHLALTDFGLITELTEGGPDPERRTITGLPEYQRRYGGLHPERFWGVINMTPDFPTVAEVVAQLYPQSGGEEIDGVVSIDPAAFAAFLDVTGPIEVDGWPEPLTARNAAEVLLHGQYVGFLDDQGTADDEDEDEDADDDEEAQEDEDDVEENEARRAFLRAATESLVEALTEGPLPSLGTLGRDLLPAVRGRHIQLTSRHAEEQAFFDRMDVSGRVAPVVGDSIGFVTQNYAGNKIDWFLDREAAYDVTWDPATGAVAGELTLTFRNRAPDEGLPASVIGWGGDEEAGQIPVADGENLSLLTIYSALPVVALEVDGQPVDVGDVEDRELGRHTYTVYVRVASGATATVVATVEGAIPAGTTYDLVPVWQPHVSPDRLDVSIAVADGWRIRDSDGVRVRGTGPATASWTLDRPLRAVVLAGR